MAESYRIRTCIGQNPRLRFRIAPVSRKILQADADWLLSEELCIDSIAARELLLPVFTSFMPRKFRFREEINRLPFSAARQVIEELRRLAFLLTHDFGHADLSPIKSHFTAELLTPDTEEADELFFAGQSERDAFFAAHSDVVAALYEEVAAYMEENIARYRPQRFHAFALTSPA